MIGEYKSQKEKEIEKLDEKIDKHLDRAAFLGGAGIGTAAASIGLAAAGESTAILSSSVIEALALPFIGGVAAAGIGLIPLGIAAGYGIRKLIKKL